MKKVKKILIYSRHGLRYPLFKEDEMIKIFNKDVINWKFKEGILTPKGEILEYMFAKFLKKYINQTGLKIKNKEFRANSLKRTLLTAKLIAISMFPFENINVDYMKNIESYEPEYNIKVKREDLNDEIIHKSDNEIKKIYEKLEKIMGVEKGILVNMKSSSSLTDDGYIVSSGKFKIATDVVDSYILKYYEGFKKEDIFKSNDIFNDIKELSIIKDRLLDNLFANKKYINLSKLNPYKLLLDHLYNDKDLSIIVGHDSNISTILSMLNLNVKGNEFEKYPIGSKLIFKIYEDESMDIDYAFYTPDQIRNLNYEKPEIENIIKNLRLER